MDERASLMEARVTDPLPGKLVKGEMGHIGIERERGWLGREIKVLPFPPQRLPELPVHESVSE